MSRKNTAGLTRPTLPKSFVSILTVLSIAIGFGLKQVGAVTTLPMALMLAALIYVVTQTGVSFAVEGKRFAFDRLATTSLYALFLAAAAPLFSLLWEVISRGYKVFDATFFSYSMKSASPLRPGGGAYHAILGTLEQVGIATLIAVPVGVLCALYLVEYSAGKRLPKAVSFFVDVMTGVPSVVTGLFIFTSVVLTLGLERSGFAAALALTILMMPVVIRTSEEMLRLVPNDLREASYALGIPKWKTIIKVVLPTAISGIITGVMLAVARVAGETAPLLLTTFLSQSINANPFKGPQAALPTFVWDQIASGTDPSMDRAWSGALTLILLVVLFYGLAKLIARYYAPKV